MIRPGETVETTEHLLCDLTEEEVAAKADFMARMQRDLEEEEAAKKLSAQEFGDRIKDLKSAISKVAREVRDQAEIREVDVVEQREEATQHVVTVRKDTGEEVRTRPMTPEEKQLGLFDASATEA